MDAIRIIRLGIDILTARLLTFLALTMTFCAGMLGHAGSQFDEGVHGGLLRTLRVSPFTVQRKDKIQ